MEANTMNTNSGENQAANARLIAAAPDLLAALELCITSEGAACFSDMNSHPEYMQRRLYAISDLARAAIAKATGDGNAKGRGESEANARLIAALESCLLRDDIADGELGDTIRAAIATATGEG
jgi:hypothetical protein